MRDLPPNLQTLYANLVQDVTAADGVPASVAIQKAKGRSYAYATEKHGGARLKRYVGPADALETKQRAAALRRGAAEARLRRRTVALLKRAGFPAPTLAMGRLLEALANAGLFERGVVLVGTVAYQLYSPLVGAFLPTAAMSTEDADLAVASLAVAPSTQSDSLLDILLRADATFRPVSGLDPRQAPRRFRSAAGLEVDVITKFRRRQDEERPVAVPALKCSAQPLRYLEYLIEQPTMTVALYGSGVKVSVPQPARFAVHKLIVAQNRDPASAKRRKDLSQARDLIEALKLADPAGFEDALHYARRRGRQWSTHVGRSLKELEG